MQGLTAHAFVRYARVVHTTLEALDAHPPPTLAANPFLTRLRSLPRLADVPSQHTAISLFCGGGGLDLGLALAGFDIVLATDIAPPHCATIAHNFKASRTLIGDITGLRAREVRRVTGQRSFDLIAGGSPCQSFSPLGQRGALTDERGLLVYEFVRLVKTLRPRAFLFENVPGITQINGGNDWKKLYTYFEQETCYRLFSDTLNAANFGVPQLRERLFVVGFRSTATDFSFPLPTHRDPAEPLPLQSAPEQLPIWVPVRLALAEVDGLPNHHLRPHGERVQNRYRTVPAGGRDAVDHTDRLHPDRPSPTVLVGSKTGGPRPHIHPAEPRHLSPREAARLQSFPDWYEFVGGPSWQYRAVGNAVPPFLALAVGTRIARALGSKS
jgi:DNA (cytosine-5)-methyltransferase 1